MTRLTETDLLHMFIERAPFALPHVRVFRRNVINRAVEIDGRTVHLRNGVPGMGDAYALVLGGRHVELETKSARGKMRDAQESWAEWCHGWGVPHLVLRARRDEAPDQTIARWLEELRAILAH